MFVNRIITILILFLFISITSFAKNFPGLNNYKVGLSSISQDKLFVISTETSNINIPQGTYYGIFGGADFFFDSKISKNTDFGFIMGTWMGLSNSFDNSQGSKDMWGIAVGINIGFANVFELSANNNFALKTYLQADWDRIPVFGIKIQPQYQMNNMIFEAGILIPMLYASDREESMFDASFIYLFKNIGLGLKYDLRSGISADKSTSTVNQYNLVMQFHENFINL